MQEITAPGVVEWGVSSAPLPGESASGNAHWVRFFPNAALVAVIDGIGHGAEAATAARTAVAALEAAADGPLDALFKFVHQAPQKKTRGVVMSAARFDLQRGTMTWLGVGNVEGVLILEEGERAGHRREALLLRGGVVGQQMPILRPATLRLWPGSLLLLATDGIHGDFTRDPDLHRAPQEIAERILAKYVKGTDDALALAVRFIGRKP